MTQVTRSRWMPYTPTQIYDALYAQPEALASFVKRIEGLEVIEKSDNKGTAKVVLDLPARKTIDTLGEVEGQPGQQLSFRTQEPFPLLFTWAFQPSGDAGTEVSATLQVDLSLFVAVFSDMLLRNLLASELDGDLERMEGWLAQHL